MSTEIERLHATIGVDLSQLKAGLSEAQSDTRVATAGMSSSFQSAAGGIEAANRRITQSSGVAGRGAAQMGIQFSQLGTQIMTGTNAAVAFSQQLPDIAFGLQGAQGAAGRFAAFMLGPWGTALTLAGLAVGLLASSLMEAADAKDAAATAADSLKEAEERLANATAAANHQTRQGILDDIARANSLRTREIQTRKTLQAELELAQRAAANARTAANAQTGGDGGTAARAGSALRGGLAEMSAEELKRQIADQDRKIASAGTAIRAGQRQVAQRDIAAATDPMAAANQRLEDAQDRYARQFESGAISLNDYKAAVIRETRARDAATAAIRSSGPQGRGSAGAQFARRAEMEAAREAREEATYRRTLGAASQGLLSAQLRLADGYEERAKLETQLATARHERETEEILTNKQLDDAQKGRLVALAEQTHALNLQTIALDKARAADAEMESRWQSLMDVQEIRRETELDLLSQQYDLARTMGDRRELSLRIVQAEHDLAVARRNEVIASAERVLASQTATKAEKLAAEAAKARAEAELEGLGKMLPGKLEGAKEANRTILDAEGFGRELGRTLEGGILEALRGKSLKAAMRDGIFNLLNDAISDAFAELSKAVFGQQGLGGLLGSLFGSIFGGSRAVGGPALGGMAYNVGDGEKFIPSTTGRILSRADAMAAAGGGAPMSLSITINGARGNQEIMEMVREGVAQGIGQYDRVVGDRVNNSYKRRS